MSPRKPARPRNRLHRTAPTHVDPVARGPGDLLDMDQAIAVLKTTRPTFYRWLRAGKLKGLKVGRQWRFEPAEIERFLRGEAPRIDLPVSPQPLIADLLARLKALGGAELPTHGEFDPQANPLVRLIGLLFRLGQCLNASDLHILPVQKDDQPVVEVCYRVDGALHTIARVDIRLLPALIAEWKRLGQCDPQQTALPQDCRIMLGSDQGKVDARVCFLPSYLGESVTTRFLLPAAVMFALDRIFAPATRAKVAKHLAAPSGLIILTGPTGSGKTTTLYSCLTHLTNGRVKVMTIEDPVEYLLPGMVQVPVNSKAGLTFARAMRSVFRSDPDVIMVGEIREQEVLQCCIQAALTGHLVLSTLHTNDAPSALTRMVNVGGDAFLVADAVKLVVAQRLVRKLCPKCSRPVKPDPVRLDLARQLARAGGVDVDALPAEFREATGCPACGQTGYRSRVALHGILEMSPDLAAALRRGAETAELRALAVGQGMGTIAGEGVRLAAEGVTSLDEVLRVVPRE